MLFIKIFTLKYKIYIIKNLSHCEFKTIQQINLNPLSEHVYHKGTNPHPYLFEQLYHKLTAPCFTGLIDVISHKIPFYISTVCMTQTI